MNSHAGWMPLLAIFILALGLRLAYLAGLYPAFHNPDSAAYEALATVTNSGSYDDGATETADGFPDDLQRPPIYPIFLGIFTQGVRVNEVSIAVIQCFLGAAFAVVFAVLVAAIGGRNLGFWVGFLYAIDWITILHAPLVLAETLLTLALTSAILVFAICLIRKDSRMSLLAGGLLGTAALIKPIAELLVVGFLLAWSCQRKRTLSGLLFLVTYAAVVVPWMARNEIKHGVFAISEIQISNLYFYTALGASEGSAAVPADIAQAASSSSSVWHAKDLTPAQRKSAMVREAVLRIREHPKEVIKQGLAGLAGTVFGPGRETFLAGATKKPPVWLSTWIPSIQILAIWALAAAGLRKALALKPFPISVAILFASSVLLLLLPAASPAGYSRFRVPAMPCLMFLAATGIADFKPKSAT